MKFYLKALCCPDVIHISFNLGVDCQLASNLCKVKGLIFLKLSIINFSYQQNSREFQEKESFNEIDSANVAFSKTSHFS